MCLVMFICTWIVTDAITFKVSSCEKVKNVKFIVANNNPFSMTEVFTEDIQKYYYQPMLNEQLRYSKKYCFRLSMTLVTAEGTIDIYDGDNYQGKSITTNSQIEYWTWLSKERKFWKLLSKTLEGYANRKNEHKLETLVVFVSYFPQVFLNQLYLLQYKWNMDVIFVLHYFSGSQYMRIVQRNLRSEIYERLPHKIVSGYFYDSIHKPLLDVILNTDYDRFEFTRNALNSRNTSCLANTTIAIVYKPIYKYFCVEDWFIDIMVWLENLLVMNNKESNVKLHIFINNPITFGLRGLQQKHKITRIRRTEDLIESVRDEKVVVMTTYLEIDEFVFIHINKKLERVLPLVGLVVRDKGMFRHSKVYFEKKPKYEALYSKENIVRSDIKDISSDDTIDLLIDTLIKVGC